MQEQICGYHNVIQIDIIRNKFAVELKAYPETDTEWFLMRFYINRQKNMSEVIKSLTKYYNWRKSFDMKQVMKVDPLLYQPLRNAYKRSIYGADKANRPVLLEVVSQTDTEALFSKANDPYRTSYLINFYERLIHLVFPLASVSANRCIDKALLILDLKGIGVGTLFDENAKKGLTFMISYLQAYYPEICYKILLINVSVGIRGAWHIIRPILSKAAQQKIEIHAGVPTKRLLELVDEESLPRIYGGKCDKRMDADWGPWQAELDQSYERRSFYPKDRSIEYKYFYNSTERRRIASIKNYNTDHEGINEPFNLPSLRTILRYDSKSEID